MYIVQLDNPHLLHCCINKFYLEQMLYLVLYASTIFKCAC
jgi:hypothetical protein